MFVVLSSVTPTQYYIAYNGITTPIDYWLQRAERVQRQARNELQNNNLAEEIDRNLTELWPCYWNQDEVLYRSWILLTAFKTTRQGQGKERLYFFVFISFKTVRTSSCRNKLRMYIGICIIVYNAQRRNRIVLLY